MTVRDDRVCAPTSFYATYIKRGLDVLVSITAIAVLLPVMGVVALAVRIVLGSPVFFFDERAGIQGKPIRVGKFRTMTNRCDSEGKLLPDAQRLGVFGRLLRRTSLDELPQLFAVVWGDMSLIGPRPLPMRYVSRYDARQVCRLLVRPGLTGWAQVHGRNAVSWPQRFELDVSYVENLNRSTAPLMELLIVVLTVFQVVAQAFTGRGVTGPGSATMDEFTQ